MNLRDIGIAIVMFGWIAGQILTLIANQRIMSAMVAAGGNANPAEMAMASQTAQSYTIYGCGVALVGVLLFAVGSSKLGRREGATAR